MDTSTATAVSTPAPAAKATGPMVLTEKAIAQVQSVMKSQGFEGYYLTVRVVPSGCSGFGYDLNLVQDTKADDTVWEQAGVRMASDALSLQYLQGTTVDYVVNATGEGFKFENPNAKSSCGCGQSFST